MTDAVWPARFQHLRNGPLVEAAPRAELILDGGHNTAAGTTLSASLQGLPPKALYVICGMLGTKDAAGYISHLASHAEHLHAVSIPGESATLPAEDTAAAARSVGLQASEAESVDAALARIIETAPDARVLICGSLYLAGKVLVENG